MNRDGFSLLEMVVAVGVLGLAIVGIGFTMQLANSMQSQSIKSENINNINYKISGLLTDLCAWQKTIADTTNTSLDCLRNNTDCSGVSGEIPLFYGGNGLVQNDTSTSTAGLDLFGSTCSTFNPTTGNNECPFRYQLLWDAICTASPCLEPQIKVTANLNYSPAHKSAINSDRGDFERLFDYKKIPKTCHGWLAGGPQKNGIYFIDPDGFGGVCPFQVYCQFFDGKGWTLAIAAGSAGYASIPETNDVLTPRNVGRLANDRLMALLAAANPSAQNNIKIDVDSSEPDPEVVALRVTGSPSTSSIVTNDID